MSVFAGISFSFKIAHLCNEASDLLDQLRAAPAPQLSHIEEAVTFVTNVRLLARGFQQLQPERFGALTTLLAAYDIAICSTFVAALLLPHLGLESEKVVGQIGLATFLQDLGLYHLNPALHHADESKMTPEEQTHYRTHPTKSVELLAGLDGVETVVKQAISQHHVRRNKRGFPHLPTDSITRIAEIVGISGDFARLLHDGAEYPSQRLEYTLDFDYFSGFSPGMVEVFKKVFFRR